MFSFAWRPRAPHREVLQACLATQDADYEAANAESDRLRDDAFVSVAALGVAQSQFEARELPITSDCDREFQARYAAEAELAQEHEAAKHASELAAAQWKI